MLLAFDCDLSTGALAAAGLLYKKEQNYLPNRVVVQIKRDI